MSRIARRLQQTSLAYQTAMPDPFLRHFFWTTPLATNATLASTSSSMVNRLVTQANAEPGSSPLNVVYGSPFNTQTATGAYSIPVWRVPLNQPRVPVWSRSDKYLYPGREVDLRATLDLGVPLPDVANIPDGSIAPSGTDGACIVLCGHEMWEFWQFAPSTPGTDPAGYDWRCVQGGYIADIRTHPGIWSSSSFFGGGSNGQVNGADWGVSASGISYLAMMLKYEDWIAPDILHPMSLSTFLTGGAGVEPNKLYPAVRNDKFNLTNSSDATADPYRLPEGTRFRLDPAFDIDTWANTHGLAQAGVDGATAAVLAKVLRCIRDYGMFITDTAGVLGFSAEANKVYGTPYGPATYDNRPIWGNFGQQMPWSSFQQIVAPTSDISVPGGTEDIY